MGCVNPRKKSVRSCWSFSAPVTVISLIKVMAKVVLTSGEMFKFSISTTGGTFFLRVSKGGRFPPIPYLFQLEISIPRCD